MEGSAPTGAQTRDIYDRPDDYDLEHAGDDGDARFYARLLRRLHPARVLEFGCGSGRITMALAGGLPHAEIVAVDASAPMLELAATHLSQRPADEARRVAYREGDMRDWSGGDGGPFDVVLIAGRSVSHLLTLDDRRRTWLNAFALLRPGGTFVLDVATPDLAMLAESQRVWPRTHLQLDVDATRDDGARPGPRLLGCTATAYEPLAQRADVRYFFDRIADNENGRFVSDFASHIYFPSELELLFVTSGFEVAQRYGDYSFAPCGRTSPYLITVAHRPDAA